MRLVIIQNRIRKKILGAYFILRRLFYSIVMRKHACVLIINRGAFFFLSVVWYFKRRLMDSCTLDKVIFFACIKMMTCFRRYQSSVQIPVLSWSKTGSYFDQEQNWNIFLWDSRVYRAIWLVREFPIPDL